jgi:hypothetical protein
MTNNIPYERALLNMDALQNYVESIDSMPSQMRKNFVLELDYIMREIEFYSVEQNNEEKDNG